MNIIIDVIYLISVTVTFVVSLLTVTLMIKHFMSSNGIDDYQIVFIFSVSSLCKILNACQN